jgi:hypothetical protein
MISQDVCDEAPLLQCSSTTNGRSHGLPIPVGFPCGFVQPVLVLATAGVTGLLCESMGPVILKNMLWTTCCPNVKNFRPYIDDLDIFSLS